MGQFERAGTRRLDVWVYAVYMLGVEEAYARLADRIERASAYPTAMFAYLLWCAVMPFMSMDAANYGISVATAFLLFLTLGSARRDRKALHTKLDALICATDGADDALKHLEDKIEKEIDEARDA